MKKTIFNKIFLILIMIFGVVSCDDRDIITIDNDAAPIIMDLSSTNLVLDHNFPDNPALTITWNAATYTIPTEINYKVQISAKEDFTDYQDLVTTKQSIRAATLTTNEMNTAAQDLGLVAFVPSKMYMRVVAYLGNDDLSITSNITEITITPYKLVYPDFYLVGEASYVGWNAGSAQGLYKKDNILTIYTYLEKDKNFRFLGQLDWNPINYSIDVDGIKTAYRYFKTTSSNISKADGDDENMKFSGETGIYKVTIDAKTEIKSLSAVASVIPGYDMSEIFLVGNIAGNGWTPENGILMTKTSPGVFEFSTVLAADTEFKIIGQKSWGDLEWGNILKDNNGYDGFLGPKNDNGNIKFVGDGSSTYKITVNLKAGTYTIVKL